MSKVKTAHLGLGLDLLGAQTSLKTRGGSKLEIWWEKDPNGNCHPLGLKAISGKNGREVAVPWANLKGLEIIPENTDPNQVSESKSQARRKAIQQEPKS